MSVKGGAERGKKGMKEKERAGIMRFPPSSRRRFRMKEWRKREIGEKRKKENEEERVTAGKKRKGEAHRGDKRHRRGILSVGSFGLLLTEIRGDPRFGHGRRVRRSL